MRRFWIWLRSLWTTKQEVVTLQEIEAPDEAAKMAEHHADLAAWDKALYDATGAGPYAEKLQREREALEKRRERDAALYEVRKKVAVAGMLPMSGPMGYFPLSSVDDGWAQPGFGPRYEQATTLVYHIPAFRFPQSSVE